MTNQVLKASNIELMNRVRSSTDLAYQSRIPVVDQGNLEGTVKNLLHNRPLMNEFATTLINRIGLIVGHNKVWNSPLVQFKKELLNAGDTIEEVQVGLVKAKAYEPDRDALEREVFGQTTPDVNTIFHRINSQRMYPLSINEKLLRRAFTPGDSYGLTGFVNDLMDSITTSDNLDEYKATCKLFSEYAENGGFFNVHVPDIGNIASDGDDSKLLLRKMRELSGNLQFVNTRYNAAHMPVHASPDELVLIATPAVQAAIDVEALAAAFNVNYMEFPSREVLIQSEDFGIEGAQAIITTNSFFQIYDVLQEMRNISNPVGLYDNFWFHHWQVISASLFAPAILFTTGPDTPPDAITVIDPTVVTVSIDTDDQGNAVESFVAGGLYSLTATFTPTGATGGVYWSLTGANSPLTFITPQGVLHVGNDETSTSLTITAFATEGSTSGKLVKTAIPGTITWPVAGVATGALYSLEFAGTSVPGIDPAVATYTLKSSTTPKDISQVSVGLSGDATTPVTITLNGKVYTIIVGSGAAAKSYTLTITAS